MMVEKKTTQDFVRTIIQSAEMGGTGNKPIYRLSYAQQGHSSWSVGVTQIDLGQQTDKQKALQDHLEKSGKFSTQEIAAVMADLPYANKAKEMSLELQAKVNGALNTPDGKKMVDGWDNEQIDKISNIVDSARAAARTNPLYGKDAAFTQQVDSDRFTFLVSVNANQFQNEKRLAKWLSGKDMSVSETDTSANTGSNEKKQPQDDGYSLTVPGRIPDLASLIGFERNTPYLTTEAVPGQINKKLEAQHTRWQSGVDVAEGLGLYTPEEAKAARELVKNGYATEEQKKNRADPNKCEVESGDTFESLSTKCEVPLPLLKEKNPGVDPKKLKIGTFLNKATKEEIAKWQAEQDAAKKAKEDAQKANGGTPAKPQKGGQKRSDLDPELGGGEITLVSGNMTADPGQVRKTLLGGSMDSPEVTEAQKRDQMLRALYPTMYPEGSSAQQQPAAPTDQGAEQDMTEEERRERRLRMLYPTMYPTTVA